MPKSRGSRKAARDKAVGGKAKREKPGTSQSASAQRKALFVEAYVKNGGNGKQAAIAVGYSPKTAESQASRLLRDVKVAAAVQARKQAALAQAVEKTDLTVEEVLADLRDGMRFDPALLYREDGSMRDMHELPVEVRRQLEGVEFEEISIGGRSVGRVAKIKFPKKTAVREQAMKHFGLFKEDNQQRQPGPLAALPLELQQRLYDRLVARGYLAGPGPADRRPAGADALGALPGVASQPAA